MLTSLRNIYRISLAPGILAVREHPWYASHRSEKQDRDAVLDKVARKKVSDASNRFRYFVLLYMPRPLGHASNTGAASGLTKSDPSEGRS